MNKEIALVYMAAGLSSRFQGKVKQLVRVGPDGETLIEYSLKQALSSGFSKIVFIVGEKTEAAFKEKFGISFRGKPVQYVMQDFDRKKRDKPLGTVDALLSVKGVIDCSFVVCNSDDLYGADAFKKLFDHLRESDSCATIGYRLGDVVPENGAVNRGIFVVKNGLVKSLREEIGLTRENLKEKGLDENDLCSMNIFALVPGALDYLNFSLEKFKIENREERTKECYLPEELGKLIERGMLRMSIYPTNEKWIGITNPEDEEIVRQRLMKK